MRLIANGSQGPTTLPTPAAPSGTPGFAYNNAPGLGQPVTILGPDDFNIVLAELMNVLAGAGLSADSTGANTQQLLQALQVLAGVSAADTGTVNALAISPSPALTSLADRQRFIVRVANTNTDAATLAVNALAAAPITLAGGQPLSGGELISGSEIELIYSATAGSFFLAGGRTRQVSKLLALTTSQTFTVPAGVTRVKATVVGGGGGGAYAATTTYQADYSSGGGGGAGGAAIGVYSVTPGNQITVTVGSGGAGGTNSNYNGAAGGSSSFGNYCSATGGAGAGYTNSGASSPGASGGSGTGGQINITGGMGCDGLNLPFSGFGNGGASIFGGGGRAGAGSGIAGHAYGAGGGGAYQNSTTTNTGGAGAAGIVIVEW